MKLEQLQEQLAERGVQLPPRPLHEAQIMELRRIFEAETSPNMFGPGDLVTPKEGSFYFGEGEPFIVVEVLAPPVRVLTLAGEEGKDGVAAPHDLRVAGMSPGGEYCVWLQRSCELVPYTGEPSGLTQ